MNTIPAIIPIAIPIALTGDKAVIPLNNGGVSDNTASLNLGFPPITSLPLGSGGLPPIREDLNGMLYLLSSQTYYQQVGGLVPWDSGVSTAIGGYPLNAVLVWFDTAGEIHIIRSSKANNTTVPSALTVGTTVEFDWYDTIPTQAQLNLKANKTLDNVNNLAVTTALINTGAVTEPKLADLSVSTRTIVASAVVSAKLATDAVETVKIKAGAVTAVKLSSMIDVVIEEWVAEDGNSWYRKWRNGWVEQGGFITSAPNGKTVVNFPVSMTSVKSVMVLAQTSGVNDEIDWNVVGTPSSTSMTIRVYNRDNAGGAYWTSSGIQ